MSVRPISDNIIAPQTNETNSLPNKFIGNSALLNNADTNAVRFITAQFVGNQTQQDDLQQEAQKVVEKHTSKGWFGLSYLDNDALGKELAAKIGERPELAKAVFERMGKTEIYTAQAMIDAAGDEQLAQAAKSEMGKQLLSQTKQAFADNIAYQKSWGELFASKEKIAADEQRIQRIDRATTEAAKAGQISQTSEVKGTETVQLAAGLKTVTPELLLKINPALGQKRAAELAPYLNQAIAEAQITNLVGEAMFLAQVLHEAGTKSDLNEGGGKITHKGKVYDYFFYMYDKDSPNANRQKAAEDLGNIEVGDGAKFHGRGYIQLTGRANYQKAGTYLDLDLVNNPDLANDPKNAVRIAAWFWRSGNGNLNNFANKDSEINFQAVTRRINGGLTNYEDRKRLYANAKKEFGIK